MEHLARRSHLEHPPVPAVGDEERAGGKNPRASRPEELCRPLQRPRVVRRRSPRRRLDRERYRRPGARRRRASRRTAETRTIWAGPVAPRTAPRPRRRRRTRRPGGCPHRRRAGSRPAARRQTSARRGPPPAAAEPRPSRRLRPSGRGCCGCRQPAACRRRLPTPRAGSKGGCRACPGSRQLPTCWTTEPSRVSSTTTWQNSSAIRRFPLRRSWTLPGYPRLSRWSRYQRRRPLTSISTTSTPKGWSANATRNVPCGVREAVSGIRFDSGERSSVETRSPPGDRSEDLPLGHTQDRERFACDEAVRVVVPPFRRICEQHAVRVEPQRPVPGPQVQRFFDRQLVDDDRRAVCGARCEDRVAQPGDGRRTARPGASAGPYVMPTSSTRAKPIYGRPSSISRSQRATIVSPVGRDQDRHLGSSLDRGPEDLDSGVVERARRLVEQEQRWLPDQPARERELLEHPRRTSVEPPGKDLGEPQLGVELLHPPACLVPVEAADLGEEEQIRPPGETKVEGAILRQQCADQAAGSERGCFVSTDQDTTAGRGEGAQDAAQDRRLAGPVAAE